MGTAEVQWEGKRMGEEKDGHKPQLRETDHCPLIPRREGVAAKKALTARLEERKRMSSRAGAGLQLGK